jgi:hypothetical protein
MARLEPSVCRRRVDLGRSRVSEFGQLETFEGDAKTSGKQSPAGGVKPLRAYYG